jgi:predicted Zn-dependent protease
MSFRGALAAVLLVLAASCSTTPPPEILGPPIDVYLLPVDDFPFEFADQLAHRLSAELNLKVRVSLPMGIGDLKELPNNSQIATEDVIARAHEVALRLPNTNEKLLVIALTTRDINERTQSLRFLFASNDRMTHTSVISVARMFATTPRVEGTQAQVGLRIYKMVKRAIGEQYFGLPRSASIADIMYAPIMSLEDIDAMGVDYRR